MTENKYLLNISKYVSRGIKYLNKKHPKWLKQIDQADLDLSKGDVCVIGQLEGTYYHSKTANSLSQKKQVKHGFDIPDKFNNADSTNSSWLYSILTEEWLHQINKLIRYRGIN